MSFPGGGRPSGVGRVEVAILITASTSSSVGGAPVDSRCCCCGESADACPLCVCILVGVGEVLSRGLELGRRSSATKLGPAGDVEGSVEPVRGGNAEAGAVPVIVDEAEPEVEGIVATVDENIDDGECVDSNGAEAGGGAAPL